MLWVSRFGRSLNKNSSSDSLWSSLISSMMSRSVCAWWMFFNDENLPKDWAKLPNVGRCNNDLLLGLFDVKLSFLSVRLFGLLFHVTLQKLCVSCTCEIAWALVLDGRISRFCAICATWFCTVVELSPYGKTAAQTMSRCSSALVYRHLIFLFAWYQQLVVISNEKTRGTSHLRNLESLGLILYHSH